MLGQQIGFSITTAIGIYTWIIVPAVDRYYARRDETRLTGRPHSWSRRTWIPDQARNARSERVMPRRSLYRHPAQLGELGHTRLAAKAAHTATLDAAERHLRFVVHRRSVDVTDA